MAPAGAARLDEAALPGRKNLALLSRSWEGDHPAPAAGTRHTPYLNVVLILLRRAWGPNGAVPLHPEMYWSMRCLWAAVNCGGRISRAALHF